MDALVNETKPWFSTTSEYGDSNCVKSIDLGSGVDRVAIEGDDGYGGGVQAAGAGAGGDAVGPGGLEQYGPGLISGVE